MSTLGYIANILFNVDSKQVNGIKGIKKTQSNV